MAIFVEITLNKSHDFYTIFVKYNYVAKTKITFLFGRFIPICLC